MFAFVKSGNRFPVFLIRFTMGLLFIVAGIGKLRDMDTWLYGKEAPVEQAAAADVSGATAERESAGVAAGEKREQAPALQKDGETESEKPAMKRQGGLLDQFKGKLPHWLLLAFGRVLPWVELIGGIWLVSGLLPRWALRTMGLTMVALTFGPMLMGNAQLTATNAVYVLILAVALKWSAEN
jgi:uncharacterized membrane protein YphA (DoxX/SURF4 family)